MNRNIRVKSFRKEFNPSYSEISLWTILKTISNLVWCKSVKSQSDSFRFDPNEFEPSFETGLIIMNMNSDLLKADFQSE